MRSHEFTNHVAPPTLLSMRPLLGCQGDIGQYTRKHVISAMVCSRKRFLRTKILRKVTSVDAKYFFNLKIDGLTSILLNACELPVTKKTSGQPRL